MSLEIHSLNKDTLQLYKSVTESKTQKLSKINLTFPKDTTINPNSKALIDFGIKIKIKIPRNDLIRGNLGKTDLFENVPFMITPLTFIGKTTLIAVENGVIVFPGSDTETNESIKITLYNYGNKAYEIKRGHQYFQAVVYYRNCTFNKISTCLETT